MNIKIQGGGSGTYANTGSCTGVTTYLQHEDLERMKNGREVQPFFNNSRDYISAQEAIYTFYKKYIIALLCVYLQNNHRSRIRRLVACK